MNHFYRPPATAPGEPAFAEERRNGNAIAARMEIRLDAVRALSLQALRRFKRPGDEIARGYAEDVIYAIERALTDCKQLTGGKHGNRSTTDEHDSADVPRARA